MTPLDLALPVAGVAAGLVGAAWIRARRGPRWRALIHLPAEGEPRCILSRSPDGPDVAATPRDVVRLCFAFHAKTWCLLGRESAAARRQFRSLLEALVLLWDSHEDELLARSPSLVAGLRQIVPPWGHTFEMTLKTDPTTGALLNRRLPTPLGVDGLLWSGVLLTDTVFRMLDYTQREQLVHALVAWLNTALPQAWEMGQDAMAPNERDLPSLLALGHGALERAGL